MWIVRLALRRPYTFVVAALLLLLLTPFVLLRTATDIFPGIDIPVVSVIWQYAGLNAQEIEQRIIYNHERSLSATVNDIEHIESNSYNGIGVIKVFLQPGASVDAGVAQITAVAQTILRLLPPGQQPPLIIRYNASTVPILQYSLSSDKLSEQELYDLAQNQVRVGLSTVLGAAVPWPYGGRTRVVSVVLDLNALRARNLSASDIVNAVNAQNLILPSGTAKIGPTEYDVEVNTSPRVLEELNDLPIKNVEGGNLYLRDVAQVRDGYQPQQKIVRQDGVRGALLTILKNGSASTLDVVRRVKQVMPRIRDTLPADLNIKEFADQSRFVRSAVSGVVKEGLIAAALTALMILLFLESWRSTLIIALSIPLSVLSAIALLSACGQTINLLTKWLPYFVNIQRGFEQGFSRFRDLYRALLAACLDHRIVFIVVFLGFCAGSWLLVGQLGQDFFPSVDAGQFRLHVRARSGTRMEETAQLISRVEAAIRREVSEEELGGILDNIGVPNSGISLSYSTSGLIGPGDADILVSLKPGHTPTDDHVGRLRARLGREFPGTLFYFLPADIVRKTLNFGLPAPFDVQIVGRDQTRNREIAAALAGKIRQIPGAVDVRVQQPGDQPKLKVAVDRAKAAEIGLSERDVASSVLLSLSGSGQVQPAYWLNPRVGIQYLINIRAPERAMDSLAALNAVPISAGQPGEGNGQILANLAAVTRTSGPPVLSHYNVAPVIDVFGGVSGRDFGGVLRDLEPLVEQSRKELPRGSSVVLRGQAETMRASFAGLALGLLMAAVLIYLLLVVNFQSWRDPFIIITALPGALAGVIWGLFISQTTLSVPALMGAIMSLGVATANSVLVVSFARDNLRRGLDPVAAALEAGAGRVRPVLMTALAMVIGMLPLSLAQTQKLRTFVRVPQTLARAVEPGQLAKLALAELPGRKFDAKVVRTAGALEPDSHTLLTELEVDNTPGQILAGSCAQVRFNETNPEAALALPANTLLFRAEGIQVGVVGAGGKVELKRVELGRDFGQTVEIISGVETSDRVILNPPDSLAAGATVRVAEAAKTVAAKSAIPVFK